MDNATRRNLYLSLGRAYEIEFQYRSALAFIEELQAFASAHADRAMELAALVAMLNVRSMPFDAYDAAHAALQAECALQRARWVTLPRKRRLNTTSFARGDSSVG